MLQKIFATGLAVACFVDVIAQEAVMPVSAATAAQDASSPEVKKTRTVFSAYADIYYRYNFAKPAKEVGYNNLTSFTGSHNSFTPGMVSLKAEHAMGKLGLVADLGFGPRAEEFGYADEGLLRAVKQLYISYSPVEWLKLTAGTWSTHIGYEVPDSYLNRNYSMSYMFTNGPFSHTGIRADITSGKHGFMLGIANPTDYRIPHADQLNKKFIIAQYSIAPMENIKCYLNYVGGKAPDTSKVDQVDIVATTKISGKFNIGFNATYCSTKPWNGFKNEKAKKWWGTALYLNLDPKPWFGLTLRGEYFDDKDQLKTYAAAAGGGSIFATTLSANFKVDGFTFIPEIRFDNGNRELFADSHLAPTRSTTSLILAAIYKF